MNRKKSASYIFLFFNYCFVPFTIYLISIFFYFNFKCNFSAEKCFQIALCVAINAPLYFSPSCLSRGIPGKCFTLKLFLQKPSFCLVPRYRSFNFQVSLVGILFYFGLVWFYFIYWNIFQITLE